MPSSSLKKGLEPLEDTCPIAGAEIGPRRHAKLLFIELPRVGSSHRSGAAHRLLSH